MKNYLPFVEKERHQRLRMMKRNEDHRPSVPLLRLVSRQHSRRDIRIFFLVLATFLSQIQTLQVVGSQFAKTNRTLDCFPHVEHHPIFE